MRWHTGLDEKSLIFVTPTFNRIVRNGSESGDSCDGELVFLNQSDDDGLKFWGIALPRPLPCFGGHRLCFLEKVLNGQILHALTLKEFIYFENKGAEALLTNQSN